MQEGPQGGYYYETDDVEEPAEEDEEPAEEDEAAETAPNPEEDVRSFFEDELAEDLIGNVNEEPEEGFTLKRNLDVEDVFETDTYYVGITSWNFSKEDGISKEDVVEFYEEWLPLLEDEPGLRIGGYSFPEGEDKISIDLTAAVDDRDEAVSLGEELNQESVANLAEMDFPDTGGDGEPVVESPDEVRDVLTDIESLRKLRRVRKVENMVDPDAVYEGVESGEQLRGRQIAYSAMHGQRSVETDEDALIVDGERFERVDEE